MNKRNSMKMTMKKILVFILTTACIVSLFTCGACISASADAPVNDAVAALETRYFGLTEDSLTWNYDASTGTLTLYGTGAMRDYTSVEPEWYQYCDSVQHIVVSDGITSVSAGAFIWFTMATDATLGASVEFIGDFAFSNCYELRSVNFPAGLKYVGEGAFNNALLHTDSGFIFPDGILYLGDGSFWSAFKESFVSIPASLTAIGENAFGNCFLEEFRVSSDNPAYTAVNGILYDKAMTTLINYPADKRDTVYEIPGSVTTVLDEAIQVTNTLEKIVIPASVSFIDEGAFYWNYALTSVEVSENNPNYQSVDGVLFTKDGKTLLCYPIADPRTEYTIPDGCERIGMAAMGAASNLTLLHIPEGLREIACLGLGNCRGLTQLSLPRSITKIESQAFFGCNALREIYYAGSSADWQNIEVEEYNEPLTDGSVAVICAG